MSLLVDSLITSDGVCNGPDAACATVGGADGTAGGALFRVYSMAANVDVDNNSVYEVQRMPMTQQGQMYHTRAGSHHGSADTSAGEVQSGRRAAVQQSLLIIVAVAPRSHGPTACWRQSDAHGLLTIGVSHVLKVCLIWYCWLQAQMQQPPPVAGTTRQRIALRQFGEHLIMMKRDC